MRKAQKWFCQGDVTMTPTSIKNLKEIEKNGKVVENNVLREGEHTGHKHVAIALGNAKIQVITYLSMMYLLVKYGECLVKHEEHGDIILPEGDYLIDFQREYDHFAEEARYVAD